METRIGYVTHYYTHIGVAVLALTGGLKLNDRIHILGHTTDLVQAIDSLEINHHKVQAVGPGADVALKVDEPVRKGDLIFLVAGEAPQGM